MPTPGDVPRFDRRSVLAGAFAGLGGVFVQAEADAQERVGKFLKEHRP